MFQNMIEADRVVSIILCMNIGASVVRRSLEDESAWVSRVIGRRVIRTSIAALRLNGWDRGILYVRRKSISLLPKFGR